jgi:regulatory protein
LKKFGSPFAEMTLEEAKSAAINYIKFKARTQKEVSDKLKTQGAQQKVIEAVIELLKEYSYLDDENYAKAWIHERLVQKKLGKMKVIQELKRKGIPELLIYDLLEEPAIDPVQNGVEYCLNKFHKSATQEIYEDKITSLLVRNGYGFSQIKEILSSLKKEHGFKIVRKKKGF